MRTTLNIPDSLAMDAKRSALEQGKTLTDLVVEGLRQRVAQGKQNGALPVSQAQGGLKPGVGWTRLEPDDGQGEAHR